MAISSRRPRPKKSDLALLSLAVIALIPLLTAYRYVTEAPKPPKVEGEGVFFVKQPAVKTQLFVRFLEIGSDHPHVIIRVQADLNKGQQLDWVLQLKGDARLQVCNLRCSQDFGIKFQQYGDAQYIRGTLEGPSSIEVNRGARDGDSQSVRSHFVSGRMVSQLASITRSRAVVALPVYRRFMTPVGSTYKRFEQLPPSREKWQIPENLELMVAGVPDDATYRIDSMMPQLNSSQPCMDA
jgi:hypothetical protein